MKTHLNLTCARRLCVALSLLLGSIPLLTGCRTVTVSETQAVGWPRCARSNPAQVQVLRTEPVRAYVSVGEVRTHVAKNIAPAKIEAAMREGAAELGADAAVIVYDHTQVAGEQLVGCARNRPIELVQGRIVVAIAIKYL